MLMTPPIGPVRRGSCSPVRRPAAIALGVALALLVAHAACADAPRGFELREGDCVALVGNTLIERDQRYGYLETLLVSRYPDRGVTFRNLGWSGDTVFGEARAGFDTAAEGFRRLREHLEALEPTVVFVGYGLNESFQGEPGLPRFVSGLGTLLDVIAKRDARIVLLAPLRHEDLGAPLPDPTEHNRSLALYRDAIGRVAANRDAWFVDLYDLLGRTARGAAAERLTDDGIHLTPYGYWRVAACIEQALGLAPRAWRVDVAAEGTEPHAVGTELSMLRRSADAVSFQLIDRVLPVPPPPAPPPHARGAAADRVLCVRGLRAGKYVLCVDGERVADGDAAAWQRGVRIMRGPDFDQAERLRRTIHTKNGLYFYRWRPQNETYLFGFRKHEQGQNAAEIPRFDPLVSEQEEAIARLRVPVPHTYELAREGEVAE
jgi:lysophospholipase L1-like esterase